MLIYIKVDMDVQSPEGGSPTHTLPSLSGGDNERKRGERGRVFLIQGNHKEQDSHHLEITNYFPTLQVTLKE